MRQGNTDLSCNDMEAVDRQLAAAKEMEAYIDSKSGGPGKGWYRIVYTPDEARAVIMAGKLAVVLGIEVDYLFNCHREGDLTEDLLRAQLDKYYAAGVRHLFPIHFDNNGFGATAFQNGLQFGIDVENPVNNEPGLPLNPFPVFAAYTVATEDAQPFGYDYRTGRRATQGLTELGKTLIREMIARGMIIDIDHMSARAKAEVLDICEAARYPVVAGHVGFVEISRGDKAHEGQLLAAEVERIRRLGGMVGVIVRQGTKDQIKTWRGPGQTVVDHTCSNTSETWVQAYLHAVAKMQGRPVAFGTDFNGLIPPTGPRFGPDACLREGGISAHANAVAYPFTAASTGERMDHSVVGEKTFDINDDGLAHIGLLPDFIADLQALGLTKKDLAPLLHSAEEYIQVWENGSPGHTRLGVLNTAGQLSVKEGPLDAGFTFEAGGIQSFQLAGG